MNNIIQIIPNMYITNIYNEQMLSDYQIDNVIIVDINLNKIEDNKLFVNPNMIIDYNKSNEFIIDNYKNNKSIIIIDTHKTNAIIIVSMFIIKYLNMNLMETLQLIKIRTNIDHKQIPTELLKQLFDYYLSI